jgi:hypothetical protein
MRAADLAEKIRVADVLEALDAAPGSGGYPYVHKPFAHESFRH